MRVKAFFMADRLCVPFPVPGIADEKIHIHQRKKTGGKKNVQKV